MGAKEIENGQVLEVKEVVTLTQKAIVKTFYDMEFHTRLVFENGLIIASVYDYENNFVEDYNSIIPFELDGQVVEVEAFNGSASIEFTSEVSGKYLVKTLVEGFRNGVLEIEV